MKKNTADQKWLVYAETIATGVGKTGDANNISAKIRIDGGAAASLTDAHPTELDSTNEPGYYAFDLTAAETDGHALWLVPKSTTAGVRVTALPPSVIANEYDEDDFQKTKITRSIQ